MPTLQTAMKWLRKSHNLFIEPRVGEIDGKTWYGFDIIPINGRKIDLNHYNNLPLVELNSYEEAVELALKYCLENLILLTMEILSDGWREELEELIDNSHSMSGGEDLYRQGVKDAIKVIESHI